MSTSNITKQVIAELEEVQQQLSTFKKNVQYLDGADKIARSAENLLIQKAELLNSSVLVIDQLQQKTEGLIVKIGEVDFPSRLTLINETVKDIIIQIEHSRSVMVDEVSTLTREIAEVNFKGKFEQLKKIVDDSAKSNEKFVEGFERQKLGKRIDEFKEIVQTQLDISLERINVANQKSAQDTLKIISEINFPLRMDKLDANVAGIQAAIMNVIGKTDNLERDLRDQFEKLNQRITSQNKVLQTRNIITIILLIALFTVLAISLFFNK